MFYCNICFTSLRRGDHATSSTCGHIFCRCCFAKVLEQKHCHVCSTSTEAIAWRDHTIPAGIQKPQDQLILVGYSLENCISLCMAGLQFKCRQDELYAKLRQDKLQQKLVYAENHFKKKMDATNHAYASMKHRIDILEKEKRDMEADIIELREKYGQKAKEAHSLRQQASGGIQKHPNKTYSHTSHSQNPVLDAPRNMQRSFSPHHQAIARTLSTPACVNASPSALIRPGLPVASPYGVYHRPPSDLVHVSQASPHQEIGLQMAGTTYGPATFDSPMERQKMQPYPMLQHPTGQLPSRSPSITPAKRRLGASPLVHRQEEYQASKHVFSQPSMSQLGLPPPRS